METEKTRKVSHFPKTDSAPLKRYLADSGVKSADYALIVGACVGTVHAWVKKGRMPFWMSRMPEIIDTIKKIKEEDAKLVMETTIMPPVAQPEPQSPANGSKFRKVPDAEWGDHLRIQIWMELARSSFLNSNGIGYLATADTVSTEAIRPSDVIFNPNFRAPGWATHVFWMATQ
jgi:hypothetical protein